MIFIPFLGSLTLLFVFTFITGWNLRKYKEGDSLTTTQVIINAIGLIGMFLSSAGTSISLIILLLYL